MLISFNKLSICNAKELDILMDKPPSRMVIILAFFAIVINFEYTFSDKVDPFLDFSMAILSTSSLRVSILNFGLV
ncbi:MULTISPECIES: hypothetical protein [Clostridium]|uniref:hypothetical protein n=1 Tax=Clostridium TaxID=1485 RepID=UPI001379273A|nr:MULTISPECIES: hypothetical protein [Clostridium]MDU4590023.1 hypothetical protein [Clostridium sp.]UZT08192.1 hypothetical protein ONV75_19800 [Clostridium sp. LQ25]